MSDRDPSDLSAFRQLEALVRGLGDELASFRRRALLAESRVKALEAASRPGTPNTEGRVIELEREVSDLQARLGFAAERTRTVLDQVRFLRQQRTRSASNGSPER